jgi:hypothetical protein
MAALSALRTAGRTVVRNPVIVVVTAAFGLLQLPQLLARVVSPLLAGVVSLLFSGLLIFVVPFFQGGIVGMANEGVSGSTRFGTFLEQGRDNYVSLLVGYLLVLAVLFVLGIVLVVGALFVGGLALAGGSETGLASVGAVGLFALLVGLVSAVAMFFAQFYPHTVVIEDLGAVAGIRHSVRTVRAHLLSTAGYTVVVSVAGGLFGVVGALVSIVTARSGQFAPASSVPTATPTMVPTLQPTQAAILGVVALLSAGVLGGFVAAYSVAFYREIRVPTPGLGS